MYALFYVLSVFFAHILMTPAVFPHQWFGIFRNVFIFFSPSSGLVNLQTPAVVTLLCSVQFVLGGGTGGRMHSTNAELNPGKCTGKQRHGGDMMVSSVPHELRYVYWFQNSASHWIKCPTSFLYISITGVFLMSVISAMLFFCGKMAYNFFGSHSEIPPTMGVGRDRNPPPGLKMKRDLRCSSDVH